MNEQDKRQQRRELDLLQRESVWLQKALFALRKADAVRDKLAETRGEAPEAYALGADLPLARVEDALEERVASLMTTVREMRRGLS